MPPSITPTLRRTMLPSATKTFRNVLDNKKPPVATWCQGPQIPQIWLSICGMCWNQCGPRRLSVRRASLEFLCWSLKGLVLMAQQRLNTIFVISWRINTLLCRLKVKCVKDKTCRRWSWAAESPMTKTDYQSLVWHVNAEHTIHWDEPNSMAIPWRCML